MLYICTVKEIDVNIVYKCYSYFYSKYIQNRSFKVDRNDKNSKSIEKFIKSNKNIDLQSLYDYLLFVANFYSHKDILKRKTFLNVQMTFGETNRKRYEEYKQNELYVKDYSNILGITFFSFSRYVEKTSESIRSLEDTERKRFKNTNNGFIQCMLYTSGYSDKNIICQTCLFKKVCSEIKK